MNDMERGAAMQLIRMELSHFLTNFDMLAKSPPGKGEFEKAVRRTARRAIELRAVAPVIGRIDHAADDDLLTACAALRCFLEGEWAQLEKTVGAQTEMHQQAEAAGRQSRTKLRGNRIARFADQLISDRATGKPTREP
jgi:hypothetical protein